MLNNFFRINLPYGLAKNEQGEWVAFNREYMPLGYNNTQFKSKPIENYGDFPIYTRFKGLTDSFISKLVEDEKGGIQKDENGNIVKFFLYDDGTNPTNSSDSNKQNWSRYFDRLKCLAKLERH